MSVYSYHTFLFPFLWKEGSAKLSRKSFAKCLNKGWKREVTDELPYTDSLYNQYHYFNNAARNAIYSDECEEAVVWSYVYEFCGDTKKSSVCYNIKNGDKTVSLAIRGVRLKLFNTGVGILVFETENSNYPELSEINYINDYGRRIFMPYSNNGECSSCADYISITDNGMEVTDGRITGKPKSYNETVISDAICFFFRNDEYSVTANKGESNKKRFYIEPIIDDRMFVACYYINKQFAEYITDKSEGEYRYLYDAENKPLGEENDKAKAENPLEYNAASALYELMFVDGEFLTCHSSIMLKQLFEKHIYDRWIEYGSLTGITEFSMITVTKDESEFLSRNFLTLYVEMIILTLAQRASLLGFEQMISDSALGKCDIRKIHKSYVLFQSQLLLKEITPQQQGMEIYNMLCENMFINSSAEEIEKHCSSLFMQRSEFHERAENSILFIIAFLGVFDFVDLAYNYLTNPKVGYKPVLGVFAGVMVVIFLLYKWLMRDK